LSPSSIPKELASDSAVVKAVAELERIGLDPNERVIYEGEVKKRMIDAIQLKTAKEEGIEQGIEQGVTRGRQELLVQLMTHRFGPVPDAIAEKLRTLSVDRLDDLGRNLLVARSYDDIARWLNSHQA